MGPGEGRELAVDERLDADARAVDPGRPPPVELLPGKGRRIDFDSYLGVRLHVERCAAGLDERGEVRGFDYRGRAPSEKDRIDARAAFEPAPGAVFTGRAVAGSEEVAVARDLAGNAICVARGEVREEVGRVEVAIRALALAEGYVNIDADLFHPEIIARASRPSVFVIIYPVNS